MKIPQSRINFMELENKAPYILQRNIPLFSERMDAFKQAHQREYNRSVRDVLIRNYSLPKHSFFLYYSSSSYEKKDIIASIVYVQYVQEVIGETICEYYRTNSFEISPQKMSNGASLSENLEILSKNTISYDDSFNYLKRDDTRNTFTERIPFNSSVVFILKPEHYHFFHDFFPNNPTMFDYSFKDPFVPKSIM